MRALITACALTLTVPLSALTVTPLSFSALVQQSTAVVQGHVVDVRAQWTADRRGIESLVVIEAAGYLKGDLGEHVTVRVPGGRVGSLVNIIPGAPRFTAGDRVVLFLTTDGPSIPVVTGTSQGVFRVTTDAASGASLVVPPVIETAAPAPPRGDLARRPLSLAAFSDAVRRAEAAR
jgi:hypothetical protein